MSWKAEDSPLIESPQPPRGPLPLNPLHRGLTMQNSIRMEPRIVKEKERLSLAPAKKCVSRSREKQEKKERDPRPRGHPLIDITYQQPAVNRRDTVAGTLQMTYNNDMRKRKKKPNLNEVDPNTGEVLDYTPELEYQPDDPLDKWGEKASSLLRDITYESCGRFWRRKRTTILRLADHVLLGKTKVSALSGPDTCATVSYYRWIRTDPIFTAAHDYIIGPLQSYNHVGAGKLETGVAQIRREQYLDEAETLGISSITEARAMLRIASAEAVATLREALASSDIRKHPQWRERVMAATAILDRADAATANRQPAALTQIDQAILMIYNEQAAPPPNGDDTADDVIDGVITDDKTAAIQHDMHDDTHHKAVRYD